MKILDIFYSVLLVAVLLLQGCANDEQNVSQIIIDYPSATIRVGDELALKATVIPETITDKVEWMSEDNDVATVSEDGVVTAVGEGATSIVASLGDVVAKCELTVSEGGISGVIIDEEHIELMLDESFTLTATVIPGNTSAVEWESSDASVATVSDEGTVTAVSYGEAIITARCGDGSAECTVSVVERPVESVTLDYEEYDLIMKRSFQLNATVFPENADNRTVTWESSDESVAIVSESGEVTGLSIGSAYIIASSGMKKVRCKVNVLGIPVESIVLNATELELGVGARYKLTATVLPEDAEDKKVTWSTSDESVVSLYFGSAAGDITAQSYGEAIITAECSGVKATCTVKVVRSEYNVGDYYYSDGSCSEEYDSSKDCIGMVLWVGDPTEKDEALKADHPECTHGLVISLDEVTDVIWQENHTELPETVNDWILANTEYQSVLIDNYRDDAQMRQQRGYMNTKALEAYNAAAENSSHRVVIAEEVAKYRETVPLPAGTSGWYVPSVKELTLLSYDGDENICWIYGDEVQNAINSKMSQASIGTQLTNKYWASNESTNGKAFWKNQMISERPKDTSLSIRFVFAF